MRGGQCRQKCFKYHDIASVMVEDNSELHTIISCRNCFNLRQGKRKAAANNRMWKMLIAEKRSRGKLAAGLGFQD